MHHSFRSRSTRRPFRASALLALLLLLGLVGLRPPPAALAACGGSATVVSNTAELNAAITAFNAVDAACDFTIQLTSEITLSDNLVEIANNTDDVTLTINGDGRSLNGAWSYETFTMTASDVTINDLYLRGSWVDGIVATGGSLRIVDSYIFGHNSSGIVVNQGELLVANTTIAGNGSDGISATGATTLRVINTTIAGNVSTGLDVAGGTALVTHVTIIDNSVGFRGASSEITINNSILADNIGSDCSLTSSMTFINFSLIEGVSECTTASYVGTIIGADPQLLPFDDYGGHTPTAPPTFGSSALNTGSNTLSLDEEGNTLAYDQRGAGSPRQRYGAVDMGAAESICDAAMDVGTSDELRAAFHCYNAITTPGSYTINLTADIDLTESTLAIDNDTDGVSLTIQGGGFAIDGQDTEGVRPLSVAADTEVTLRQATITGGNIAANFIGGGGIHNSGRLTITDSLISGNSIKGGVDVSGGGIHNRGVLTLVRSTVDGNLIDTHNNALGGGIANFGRLLIRDSSITNNVLDVFANAHGGGIFHGGVSTTYADVVALTIINSTISGNEIEGIQEALEGGGLYATDMTCCSPLPYAVEVVLINTTITNNAVATSPFTTIIGSGATFKANDPDTGLSVTIYNSILAGNITNNPDDLFGEDCWRSTQSYLSFTSFSSLYGDSVDDACGLAAANPDGNGNRVGIDPMLGELADNGGPTQTHLPADDSPAVNTGADDFAVDEKGDPLDNDQRGDGFPRLLGGAVDMGAVETEAKGVAIYLSAAATGTTADGLTFDNSDILKWDGMTWSLAFDGSAALLAPNNKSKHNVNAFWIGDDEIIMSFAQQGRKVPGIGSKVDGPDLVRWDGSAFSLWFDGSDVGLEKKSPERIDALHVLPGSAAPPEFGEVCAYYLLVSTQGPGAVPQFGGGVLKFSGEDVLGFCATNVGDNTAGFWQMVLDGSAEGVKKNAIDSLSLSADGETLYLTTKAAFNVDAASGSHSMVYAYDIASGDFSGPVFIAADNGLTQKVDGLQMN